MVQSSKSIPLHKPEISLSEGIVPNRALQRNLCAMDEQNQAR